MPAKSAKQEKFMQAVAHSPAFAKKVGVSQSVGREFVGKGKTMKKRYDDGGEAKGGFKKMMADKMGRAMKKKSADTKGRAMKFAGGGLASGHKSADGVASKGKTKAKHVAMRGGGKC